MDETKSTLIVFGGLPGTGKTTLARAVAQERSATYLRIDAIEQALRSSGVLAGGDVGPAGYLVAYTLAESNLLIGRMVVADSVNPLAITRDAWRRVAATTSSKIVEIEVVCSDLTEHRRRVETRSVDVPGLALPRECLNKGGERVDAEHGEFRVSDSVGQQRRFWSGIRQRGVLAGADALRLPAPQ